MRDLLCDLATGTRMAEILLTLGHTYAVRKSRRLASEYVPAHFRSLEGMRSTLGLLQHHDAVTGTARREVTADYLSRYGHRQGAR